MILGISSMAAASRTTPVSSPSSKRSYDPPAGGSLSRVRPSSRKAAELSHSVWASPEYKATGRAGKASSSERFVGVTGGFQRYSRHPWASSQPVGRRSAKRFMRATQSASLSPRNVVAREDAYTAEWKKCRCESWKPGTTSASSKSRTSGAAALPFVSRASARTSSRGPTAAMRSPETATAAGMAASPPVNTRSLSMIVSMRIRCSFPNVPLRVRIVVLRSARHPSLPRRAAAIVRLASAGRNGMRACARASGLRAALCRGERRGRAPQRARGRVRLRPRVRCEVRATGFSAAF